MNPNVGSVSVKVLPDLTEFKAILDAIPDAGFTVTETVDYTYTAEGFVASTVKTTQVTKG